MVAALPVLARVLLASLFIGMGIAALAGALTADAAVTAGTWARVIVELALGALVLTGWQARWVALLVAALMLGEAATVHAFWRYAEAERAQQLLHCLKNLAIAGGFLLLAGNDFARRAKG